ncbi:hypothetical protein H4R27_000936 [Coemansia aciculifera]|nr:hypothetical protein H4R27_000936 [Coemansia aciculifera]
MHNSKSGVTHAASSAHISDNDMSTNDSRSVEEPAPCVGTEVGANLSEQRAPANDTGDTELSSPPQHEELSLPPPLALQSWPKRNGAGKMLQIAPKPQVYKWSVGPRTSYRNQISGYADAASRAIANNLPWSDLSKYGNSRALRGALEYIDNIAENGLESYITGTNRPLSSDQFAEPVIATAPTELITKASDVANGDVSVSTPPASDKQHVELVSDAATVVPAVVEANSAADANDASTSAPPTNIEQQGELASDAPATVPLVAEASKDSGDNTSTSEDPARDKQQVGPVSDVSTVVLPVGKVDSVGTDDVPTSVDPANSGQPAEPGFLAFTTVLPVIKTSEVDANGISAIAPHASCEQDTEPVSAGASTLVHINVNPSHGVVDSATDGIDTQHAKSRAGDKAKDSALNISAEKDSAVNTGGSDRSGHKVTAMVSVTRSVKLAFSVSAPTPSPIAAEVESKAENKGGAKETSGSGSSTGKADPPAPIAQPEKLVSSTSAPTPSPIAVEASHDVSGLAANDAATPNAAPSAGGMAEAEADKKAIANKDSVSGDSNGAVATPTSFAPPEGPVTTVNASTPVPVDAKASHSVGSSVSTGTFAQLGTSRANRSDKGKEPEGRNASDVANDDLPTSEEYASSSGGPTSESLNNLGEGSSGENESFRRRTVDYTLDSIITEQSDIAEGPARNSDGNSFGASIVIQPLKPVLKSDTAGQSVVLVTDTNDNVQPTVPCNSNSVSADGDADMQDTDSPKGTDAQTVGTDAEMRDARLLDTDADTDMCEARPLDTDTEMREVVPLADDDVMQDAELPRGTGELHVVEPPPADVEMEAVHPPVVELKMEDAEPLHTNADLQAPVLPDYDEDEADVVLPPPEDLLMSEAVTKPCRLRAKAWMALAANSGNTTSAHTLNQTTGTSRSLEGAGLEERQALVYTRAASITFDVVPPNAAIMDNSSTMSANTPPPDSTSGSSGGPVPFNIVGNSGLVLERLKNIRSARRAAIAAELTGANLSMLGKRSFDDAFGGGLGNSEPKAKSRRNIKSTRAIASLYSKSTKSGLTKHGA